MDLSEARGLVGDLMERGGEVFFLDILCLGWSAVRIAGAAPQPFLFLS